MTEPAPEQTRVRQLCEWGWNTVAAFTQSVPEAKAAKPEMSLQAANIIGALTWIYERAQPEVDWRTRALTVSYGMRSTEFWGTTRQIVYSLPPSVERDFAVNVVNGCMNDKAHWLDAVMVALLALKKAVGDAGPWDSGKEQNVMRKPLKGADDFK